MKKIILTLIFFFFCSDFFCQETNKQQTFIARRIGYFNATLILSKDSSYQYTESNHRRQKLNDYGKLLFKNNSYYLNSSSKTKRTSTKNKSKSDPFYKFDMQKINYTSDKIVLIPCDFILPENCTFIRTNN